MRTDLAHAAIEAVAVTHRHGHTCTDGKWWNANAGTRSPCPTYLHLVTATEQITRLHESVHGAAHDDRHVAAVVRGMLADPPAEDMEADALEGWTHLARLAIEALAASLDGTTQTTAARTASGYLRTT